MGPGAGSAMEQLGLCVQDSSAGPKPLSPSSEGPSQVEYRHTRSGPGCQTEAHTGELL